MRISLIEISNYSRLEDAELEVRGHLILVGPNDVGKSSLLRLMQLTLGSSLAQIYADLSVDDLRESDKPLTCAVTFTDLDENEVPFFPDEINVDDGVRTLTVELAVAADSEGTLDIRRTARGSGTSRQISRDQLSVLGWRMTGAAQNGNRDFRNDRNAALDDILQAIDLGDEKSEFQKFAEGFQGKLNDSTVLAGLRNQLASQLTRAFPDQVADTDLSFVSPATATEDVLSEVRLMISKDGEARALGEQSDGARALFAMALYDLVSESANIVAIDEPEIHLHPSSQRSLARLLQAGSNQKVLATHSADVVKIFDPECVTSVRLGGKLVQPVSGFLSDDEKMVAHWWTRNHLEALTARGVIAVEGVADRIIVEAVARLTDRELDRCGHTVIEMGGWGDIAAVHSLFGAKGFQVNLATLIDDDAREEALTNLGHSPEDDPSMYGIFVSNADLEDEYVSAIGPDALMAALSASSLFTKGEIATVPKQADGSFGQADVATLCRGKRGKKVRAALVAARTLSTGSAAKVKSVHDMLSYLATLK